MIFRLPQWAGYRDRASMGIADTHFRRGKLDKALKWLGDLKERSPKFFASQKGDEIEKLVTERQERVKAAHATGDGGGGFFKGFTTGFEPDEAEWFGELKDDYASVRAPGIDGGHALLLDALTRDVPYFSYRRPLKNLTPGGTYWFEIWYRDIVRAAPPPPSAQAFVQVNLVGTPDSKFSVSVSPALIVRGSHHHWHKLGAKLKVPAAQDFDLVLHFYYPKGAYLFDGLSVRPVSDRQLEALTTFQEGPKTP
jgi:hypothetical protein